MDALIIVFVTGLISMFIAMAKKPVLVLATALIGLSSALALMINQWWSATGFIQLNYEGLLFDKPAILYSSLAISFVLLIVAGGYSYFKQEV